VALYTTADSSCQQDCHLTVTSMARAPRKRATALGRARERSGEAGARLLHGGTQATKSRLGARGARLNTLGMDCECLHALVRFVDAAFGKSTGPMTFERGESAIVRLRPFVPGIVAIFAWIGVPHAEDRFGLGVRAGTP
jgi:hypothetical protein